MNDNKLIAEFMGWKKGVNKEKNTNQFFFANTDHWYLKDESELEFHTSWSWLMPVGEKIDAMFGEDDEVDDAINRVHNAVLSFDIDNTYRAIVEFIEDYNDGQ
tara:strand:- start:156 stop:464 length:309 start_codon:yes stop_codon:yes gene_type:complete